MRRERFQRGAWGCVTHGPRSTLWPCTANIRNVVRSRHAHHQDDDANQVGRSPELTRVQRARRTLGIAVSLEFLGYVASGRVGLDMLGPGGPKWANSRPFCKSRNPYFTSQAPIRTPQSPCLPRALPESRWARSCTCDSRTPRACELKDVKVSGAAGFRDVVKS